MGARPEQEPSAPPAPEPERQEGHAYAGTHSAAWGQPQHQASPGASQQPRGHSCGYSCGAPTSPNSSRRSPTGCSTSPRSPPGPPSPSSASSPSFASSPACPASSSSPPSTWCSPPLSSACPCPPCSQATCSTPPSPSSTLSAPSSSSCPACTSSMFEASPLEILLAGVSGSLAPM